MSMEEGVVQRRKFNNLEDKSTVEVEQKNSDDYSVDSDDYDSKETRLTLMEDILLLGLKDREVYSYYNSVFESIILFRVTHHFGMILSAVAYVAVF